MVQQLTSISNWVHHQHHRRHHPLPHGTPVTSNCLQTYEIVSYHWKQNWRSDCSILPTSITNSLTSSLPQVAQSHASPPLLSALNSVYGDDSMDPLLSSFLEEMEDLPQMRSITPPYSDVLPIGHQPSLCYSQYMRTWRPPFSPLVCWVQSSLFLKLCTKSQMVCGNILPDF